MNFLLLPTMQKTALVKTKFHALKLWSVVSQKSHAFPSTLRLVQRLNTEGLRMMSPLVPRTSGSKDLLKHKGVLRVLPILVAIFPVLVLASPLGPQNFSDVASILIGIFGLAFPAIVALALLTFFWGLAKFLGSGGSEKSVEEGKKLMLWGIIGLFVMLSMWTIVALLTGSFFDMSLGLPKSPRF